MSHRVAAGAAGLLASLLLAIASLTPAAAGARGPRAGAPAPRGGAPTATGDPREVTRPSVPGTCRRLTAALTTSTGQFSAADESAPPDTTRIQQALDACAGTGRAVALSGAPGGAEAYLSAPLTVRRGEVLLVDSGVTLYASRNPADYQIPGADTCGTITANGNGCAPFIALAGSHSAVMGTTGRDGRLGVIDGRGEMTMIGSPYSWWQIAEQAKSGGNQNNPKLIESDGADDLTIYHVELANSPMYHLLITDGRGLTVWGTVVDTPAAGARNTDGVDPESESDVTIAHDVIQDGDDCIAIKSDPGLAARNVTVKDTRCYGTHGISIGSQTAGGIGNVLVRDDTINGIDSLGNPSTSDNGIRIKSDALVGGVTSQVTYRDICMTAVKYPLYFNPYYAPGGSSIPTFEDIVLDGIVAVNSPTGTSSLFEGYDAAHPLALDLENIRLDTTTQTSQYANIGVANSNVVPSGNDVTVTPLRARGRIPSCEFAGFGYPPVP